MASSGNDDAIERRKLGIKIQYSSSRSQLNQYIYLFRNATEGQLQTSTKAVSLHLKEYLVLHTVTIHNFIRNTKRETITMCYLQYQQPCNVYLVDTEVLLLSCCRSLIGIRSYSFPDSKLRQLRVQEQSLPALDC